MSASAKCLKCGTWSNEDIKCPVCNKVEPQGPDGDYNKKEFDQWFYKLMNVDYPCFYRDILRAEKKTLWKRFKIVADEYNAPEEDKEDDKENT